MGDELDVGSGAGGLDDDDGGGGGGLDTKRTRVMNTNAMRDSSSRGQKARETEAFTGFATDSCWCCAMLQGR